MEQKPQTEATPKVTVENLLKLKRHEQPSGAFWNQFDRELEKKRLQAMVTRESFPRRLFQGVLVRFHPTVALGVASAFVLGFLLLVNVDPETRANPVASVVPSAEQAESEALQSDDFRGNSPNYAAVSRSPSNLTIMETDFGVDVIAPKPQTFRFRAYRTDMEPAQFKVSPEKSLSYLPDSLSLTPSSSARSF